MKGGVIYVLAALGMWTIIIGSSLLLWYGVVVPIGIVGGWAVLIFSAPYFVGVTLMSWYFVHKEDDPR